MKPRRVVKVLAISACVCVLATLPGWWPAAGYRSFSGFEYVPSDDPLGAVEIAHMSGMFPQTDSYALLDWTFVASEDQDEGRYFAYRVFPRRFRVKRASWLPGPEYHVLDRRCGYCVEGDHRLCVGFFHVAASTTDRRRRRIECSN